MSLSFFKPDSKVHKQRNIMRDTDWRLVRYSKRGLALSLVVFSLGMILGEYYNQQPVMAAVFAAGILLSIVIRAYYLFRFEVIYARAPNRWRNIYFATTLIGATWWGLMLASVTHTIGLSYESPLLWLYTIAFFSSCSHVFSPYLQFYRLYMMVSLLPCSLVAMASFNALDSVYGLIMLVLFLLLQHQGRGQGRAYWDRLQANYDLTQRAHALEAEKITSESSLSNKDTLFTNLAGELNTSLREIMGSLELLKVDSLAEQEQKLVTLAQQKSQQQLQIINNIQEYSQISRDEVVLDNDVIDLRSSLEKAIVSVSDLVYKKELEIFSQFSHDFPITVRGDADRIQQIIANMITSAIDYAEQGCLLVDIGYTGINEQDSKLDVVIDIETPIRNPEVELKLHDAFKPHYATDMFQGLSLAIAKGLANSMGGSAGANYIKSGQLRFWFTAMLPMVKPADMDMHNISKLNGKRLLLYQPPKIIEAEYKNTLESWGFIVDIHYSYDAAIAAVQHSLDNATNFDAIMIYTHINDMEGVALAKVIAEETREFSTPQLLCITETQSKLPAVQQLLKSYNTIELVLKPIGYKQLRQQFKKRLITKTEIQPEVPENFLTGKKVLLLQQEAIDSTIAEVMLLKLGCEVKAVATVNDALEELKFKAFDAFITESHLQDTNMKSFIEAVRTANGPLHPDGYVIPIFGLTNHEIDGEETRCLECGMNYYIDSPLQVDDLRAILRRWIGRAIHMAEQANQEQIN